MISMSFKGPSLALLIIIFGMFISSLLIINAQMIEKPIVTITFPDPNQKVKPGTLTVYGTSSDNALRPCYVTALLNEERPYQNVTATGPEGKDDYSKWTFTFDPRYSVIQEGVNEISSRIICQAEEDDNGVNPTGYKKINVSSLSLEDG